MSTSRADRRQHAAAGGGRAGRIVACAAVLLLLVGCRGIGTGDRRSNTVSAGPGNRPWYAGTPEMQASIRKLLAQVPNTTGAGRIELGRRIVSFGEPAIPILVETLGSDDAALRGTAAWLLGFSRDARVVDALARTASDPDRLVRYEAASSLLSLGDPRGLHGTIDGLEDADPRIRAKCLDVLERHTGRTFGFAADGNPVDRAAAVSRWRAWAAAQGRGSW
jgi:hypothetical protein